MGIVSVARLAAWIAGLVVRHDHVNWQANQPLGKVREPFYFSLGISIFQDDIFAFNVTEVAQALAERLDVR